MFELLFIGLLAFVVGRPYYISLFDKTEYAEAILLGTSQSTLNALWRKYTDIAVALFFSIIGLVGLMWTFVYVLPEFYPFSECADDPFSLICRPYWIVHFEIKGLFVKWLAVLLTLTFLSSIVWFGYRTLGEHISAKFEVISAAAFAANQLILFHPLWGFTVCPRDSLSYEPGYKIQKLAEDRFLFDVSPPNTFNQAVGIRGVDRNGGWPPMRSIYEKERSRKS